MDLDLEESLKKPQGRNTHASPPQAICNIYKKYQKMEDPAIDQDPEIVDFGRGLTSLQKASITPVDTLPSSLVSEARDKFMSHWPNFDSLPRDPNPTPCTIYEHKNFPGLRLLPSLLPPECQFLLLDSVLHKNLSNPLHKTNLSQDYNIPYPSSNSSFFSYPPHSKSQVFSPLNPLSSHKSLNTTQFLHKKLRWLTLGAQYDWSTRAYPPSKEEAETSFPDDIKEMVETLFKDGGLKAESGVCLLYGKKDYMPVHRDVSEECERGLASFTVGCDGLFVISRDKYPSSSFDADVGQVESGDNEGEDDREMEMCVLRVRSGDCVWMGGETRWCWHAMPKILADTCPEWLAEWPVGLQGEGAKEFERWRGFMRGKRLNISCRQVWD